MSSRPAGVPQDALEISLEQLQKMAETDPSLRPLVSQALAVSGGHVCEEFHITH